MRSAFKVSAFSVAILLAACGKNAGQQVSNQNMAAEDNLTTGLPANADIETLPPDESSGTSPEELNTGDDNPDVNDLNNGN